MGKSFSVPSLTACRMCGGVIRGVRFRAYCSKECRDKWHRRKLVASGYTRDVQRKQRDARAIASPDRFKCAICSRWYRRPLHHAWQRHGVSAVEYKRALGLAVGRGIISERDAERMRLHVFENGTVKNLEKGAKRRYKVGDPRAKTNSNPWGGKGAPHNEDVA